MVDLAVLASVVFGLVSRWLEGTVLTAPLVFRNAVFTYKQVPSVQLLQTLVYMLVGVGTRTLPVGAFLYGLPVWPTA